MKPFDLVKALEGQPVVTRNRKPVTQLTSFSLIKDDYCLYGVIDGRIHRWVHSGEYDASVKNHDLDLFMFEAEQWVNVYWDSINDTLFSKAIYPTQEEAKINILHAMNYQTTIKLRDSKEEN